MFSAQLPDNSTLEDQVVLDPAATTRRLASWKEIAAYLGRDIRTVIRWEKERGLPVHRDSSGTGRPTVFADVEELDRWLMGHSGDVEAVTESAETADQQPINHFTHVPPAALRRPLFWGLAVLCLIVAVLSSYLLTRHAAEHHLQFARVDFPSDGPMSVAVADFDRDGNLDIAFTNSASDTVDILFGDGRGAFPRRVSQPNSKQPERLAIADFNGDGNPDLAITHRGSHDMIVLLGDGHGAFRESFRWDAGGRSRWATAADLNHDGMIDLVVAGSGAKKVFALLGRGDGTFDRIHQYDTDGEPSAAIVADFNHDHVPDIVTADYKYSGGRTVSLYAGNGDGTFKERKPFPTGHGPLGISAADFNHDGSPDVVTADFHDGLSVLLATPTGFSAPQTRKAESAPGFVTTGDFDLDGNIDILLVAEHSNEAHLYYGNGRGDFSAPQTFATGAYPDAIAVADFDKDGRPDFVVGATYGNLVSVYLNRMSARP